MAVTRYLDSYNIWYFTTQHKEQLREQQAIIAESDDGRQILLSVSNSNKPVLSLVSSQGVVLTELEVSDYTSCYQTANALYTRLWEPPPAPAKPAEKPDEEPFEIPKPDDIESWEPIINEREEGLLQAFGEFVKEVVMDDNETNEQEDSIAGYDLESIWDSLDVVLDCLHNRCGISVWRPTIYKNEKQKEIVDEYPYGEVMSEK